jgi:hypothetical protein
MIELVAPNVSLALRAHPRVLRQICGYARLDDGLMISGRRPPRVELNKGAALCGDGFGRGARGRRDPSA